MNRRQFWYGAIAAACGSRAHATSAIRALTGDTFFDGSTEVRLIDVIAPAPLDPYGNEATLALSRLLAGRSPSITDVAPPDRWERRIATVSLGLEALSLQEALVAAGSVRVRPQSDDSGAIAALLELEAEARDAKRGLWADWRYRVFDAAAAEPATGAFHLVEGIVVQAVSRGSRVYLNFGEDYRTDFTATAKSGAAKKWSKEGVDLLAFAGAKVRVRGYVAWINGPSIELTHPRQLEILARPAEQHDVAAQAGPSN